jgi:hypothetical protein
VEARGRRSRLWRGKQSPHPLWGAYGIDNVTLLAVKPNQLQYEWGAIAAFCIGLGNRSYKISAVYIEYENVADPGDPVTVPAYEKSEGREYYESLAFSSDRDFLRVPLSVQPTLGIETGYEDYFTEGVNGNKLTFSTQSQGTSGFHGKPYSNAANSKVFGVALVATPEFADPTKDLIFARTYFEVADQAVKPVSSQFGITWEVPFLGEPA